MKSQQEIKQAKEKMKKFSNVKIGDGNSFFSEINVINQLLAEGQKRVEFSELSDYCRLKKNQNFLIKRFKKLGFVPSFFVKNDQFCVVSVIEYTFRGRKYEELSCMPLVSAHGKFKRFEIG